MKCSEYGHTEIEFKLNYEFCFRCNNKSHRCDTGRCEILAEKTFEQNKFVISIIIGEQIINSRLKY